MLEIQNSATVNLLVTIMISPCLITRRDYYLLSLIMTNKILKSHPAHVAHAHAVWPIPRPRHLDHSRSRFSFFNLCLSEILRVGLLQRGLPKKGQKVQIPTMLQCPCHEEELSWTFLLLLHKVFVEKKVTFMIC